jgi:hypothetical protein
LDKKEVTIHEEINSKEERKMSGDCEQYGLCLSLLGGLAFADEKGPVEIVADGCSKEIGTYCKGVTPGEGRVLACLFAYGDKLSSRCEYALYDAAAQRTGNYCVDLLANECKDDLKTYCSDIKPGEGQLSIVSTRIWKSQQPRKQTIKDVSKK